MVGVAIGPRSIVPEKAQGLSDILCARPITVIR